ncbi:MAG TPA: formate--tetrahydrofolate ligase [bacterium]|nr:formate--tetrahydrofolate ligase [bacterium]HOL34276.1 formate--tetrahydrofolate ligase [bacterium]HPP07668.1 formate--tetrahydrofolate ligase [bacterium]
MLSDLEIAQKAKIKDIREIAESIGIDEEFLELYGNYKAKVSLEIMRKIEHNPLGKYIDVTAITPTPLGEGKTVTTIGLSQAIGKLKKRVFTCIRQPSLGPVFGIKGGAAGGGYSQVIPMEDFNLHLTGDVHAVGIAHNLLAAFIDNSLLKGNPLNIDPLSITWPRVVDVSDRALRHIIIGLGGKDDGIPRETGFDITVASEVMAILALTSDIFDLKKRLSNIIIGTTKKGAPVTAADLKASGAMTVLLKDAIKPTLMQTLEHTPVFVHAGPFANIAHGNSSIIADKIALRLADYVVTESGFGADCGFEKFANIKCRYSGLKPDCVVIVCSIRALKMHSGQFKVIPGKPLDKGLIEENLDAIKKGSTNLTKHIENVSLFGIPAVVAINRFTTDTEREVELVKELALNAGAKAAEVSNVWAEGGNGGLSLASKVLEACEEKHDFHFLYPLEKSIKEKIEIIATKIYGAERVSYSPTAEEKIKLYTRWGFNSLPICMAKTHLSLSHDPNLKGAPKGFTLPIEDVRLSAGAGFIYPLCGKMRTMPGLPTEPAGTRVDIDEKGRIVGLF